jgi:hypothetical protein
VIWEHLLKLVELSPRPWRQECCGMCFDICWKDLKIFQNYVYVAVCHIEWFCAVECAWEPGFRSPFSAWVAHKFVIRWIPYILNYFNVVPYVYMYIYILQNSGWILPPDSRVRTLFILSRKCSLNDTGGVWDSPDMPLEFMANPARNPILPEPRRPELRATNYKTASESYHPTAGCEPFSSLAENAPWMTGVKFEIHLTYHWSPWPCNWHI